MTDRKNYLDVPWAVFEGSKVVPADYKRSGFTVIAQCYMCTDSDSEPEKVHAARIVELHNALLGIDGVEGYLDMMRAHVAAQHDSLGRMADTAAKTSTILAENGELIGKALARIEELEAALSQCETLFRVALPKFNWGASALDAEAIRLLNEVPMLVNNTLKGVP